MSSQQPRFGKFIGTRQKELGWTEQDLSMRSGLSRSTIQKMKASDTADGFRPEALITLREVLGVKPSEFPAHISGGFAERSIQFDPSLFRSLLKAVEKAGATVDKFVADAVREKLSAG